jgi:hypothetical protein
MKTASESGAGLLLAALVLALTVAFSGVASAEQTRWQPALPEQAGNGNCRARP